MITFPLLLYRSLPANLLEQSAAYLPKEEQKLTVVDAIMRTNVTTSSPVSAIARRYQSR